MFPWLVIISVSCYRPPPAASCWMLCHITLWCANYDQNLVVMPFSILSNIKETGVI